MSLKRRAHHKMCGMPESHLTTSTGEESPLVQPAATGYALIALLALMTLLALFAIAVAPSIAQQAQREREKEAIFRGEQVAAAIRDYYISRGGSGVQSLPTSIDQLLEGIPVLGGSKKRQILRASAARDPLSTSGEWRLILPRSEDLMEFQRAVIVYANNSIPTSTGQQMQLLQQLAAPPIVNVLSTGSTTSVRVGENASVDSTGPFVGVSSRSENNSILYYYGIDRHDRWVFTPLFR